MSDSKETAAFSAAALEAMVRQIKEAGIDPIYRGPIFIGWDLASGPDQSFECSPDQSKLDQSRGD